MDKRIALITGATSGIGAACAQRFYDEGYDIIITGRRQERLDAMAATLDSERVYRLCFDVRNRNQVVNALNELPQEWKKIDILVNNAGLALGLSTFFNGNIDHWDTMMDTNVKGLLYVSRAVSQGMIERKSGHIINIGSIAGKEVYMNGNVYCASKHAVDALSKAMRIELAEFGIRVGAVHPGAVETEFSEVRFEGDTDKAAQVYKGFENLVAEDVADAVFYMASRKPHVNINDLIIMPQAQPVASIIHRK
jgi:3-hydroxy acid dehydrogenase / malonic semialdehyde reductase